MNKNILLVEDDFDILNLISLSLGRAGFGVTKALNYNETLKELEKNSNFDIILMDYYLPEVDGISLSKRIYERNLQIPVILFTAADIDQFKENLPENIVDTIKKPFSIDEVVEKLNKIIKMKQYFSNKISNSHLECDKTVSSNMTSLIYTEKAESLKSLLSMLSHNIKNALQTISTNVELLEKGYIDKENRTQCFQSIKRKIDLIKRDLDILKHPEEFQKEEAFSIKNCIRDVLTDLKKTIKEKDVYIKTDFAKKLPLYNGKKAKFHIIIKDILTILIGCIPIHGALEISLSSHQQEYFLEFYQSGIVEGCDNTLKFFDIHYKDGAGLARAVLNLKEINGRLDVSLFQSGELSLKIYFPMH